MRASAAPTPLVQLTTFLIGVPETPNITAINQWGSFELEYPRLAFIDGSEDRESVLLHHAAETVAETPLSTHSLALRDPSLASRQESLAQRHAQAAFQAHPRGTWHGCLAEHLSLTSTRHPQGVHHWDENGRLDDDVPKAIRKVHAEEIKFVKAWMKEWEGKGKWRTGPWRN